MMRPDYTKEDLVEALRAAGLRAGDVIFSHSNVGVFGVPPCLCKNASVYELWRDAMMEVIGKQGTWVLPTFSYSFCHSEVFDPKNTPGVCGLLSEEMRRDPDSVRSEDANFSVVAVGAHAERLTMDASPWTFDGDCFFARFLGLGGKFVNMNVHPATTFIHYVEAQNHVPYRWHKAFEGMMVLDGQMEKRTYYHFVRDMERHDCEVDFSRFNKTAYDTGAAVDVPIGKGRLTCISAVDTKTIVDSNLSVNMSFLIRG